MSGERSKHVFDDDDRAVHDDAEIHRAERQKVRRNAADAQADERREQRERNDGRHDGGRAAVPQEHVQHERHEQRAFEQIAKDRGERRGDEL